MLIYFLALHSWRVQEEHQQSNSQIGASCHQDTKRRTGKNSSKHLVHKFALAPFCICIIPFISFHHDCFPTNSGELHETTQRAQHSTASEVTSGDETTQRERPWLSFDTYPTGTMMDGLLPSIATQGRERLLVIKEVPLSGEP